MGRCLIPAGEARAEIAVTRSRFIATAGPVFTVDEARAFVARIKKEFAAANHNASAYLVGHGATVIAHSRDDGEPAGTAGRPALAILRGSGLGDVAVVVTRYFGGIKLGTGGLVRAYGDAVREVLSVLPRAEKVPTHTTMMALPYGLFERARSLVTAHGGDILDEDFGADVTMTVRFCAARFPAFQDALQQLSRGTVLAEVIEADQMTIMPVDHG
jgi:uncharacterized YigZ family protein